MNVYSVILKYQTCYTMMKGHSFNLNYYRGVVSCGIARPNLRLFDPSGAFIERLNYSLGNSLQAFLSGVGH